MYETVYLLVVPGGFHNRWIKFHFDVQNTKEYLYSKNFTLIIGTTFCSVTTELGYTQAVRFHPTRDMMPAIAIDECKHSPKNATEKKKYEYM